MRRQKIGRSVVEKSRAEIVLKKKPGKSEGRKKYGLTAALQQTEIFILDFVAANEKSSVEAYVALRCGVLGNMDRISSI